MYVWWGEGCGQFMCMHKCMCTQIHVREFIIVAYLAKTQRGCPFLANIWRKIGGIDWMIIFVHINVFNGYTPSIRSETRACLHWHQASGLRQGHAYTGTRHQVWHKGMPTLAPGIRSETRACLHWHHASSLRQGYAYPGTRHQASGLTWGHAYPGTRHQVWHEGMPILALYPGPGIKLDIKLAN